MPARMAANLRNFSLRKDGDKYIGDVGDAGAKMEEEWRQERAEAIKMAEANLAAVLPVLDPDAKRAANAGCNCAVQ